MDNDERLRIFPATEKPVAREEEIQPDDDLCKRVDTIESSREMTIRIKGHTIPRKNCICCIWIAGTDYIIVKPFFRYDETSRQILLLTSTSYYTKQSKREDDCRLCKLVAILFWKNKLALFFTKAILHKIDTSLKQLSHSCRSSTSSYYSFHIPLHRMQLSTKRLPINYHH